MASSISQRVPSSLLCILAATLESSAKTNAHPAKSRISHHERRQRKRLQRETDLGVAKTARNTHREALCGVGASSLLAQSLRQEAVFGTSECKHGHPGPGPSLPPNNCVALGKRLNHSASSAKQDKLVMTPVSFGGDND